MKRWASTLTCVFSSLLVAPAHAYIDPGSGSMAVQMIIGGLVAGAFVIKTYYYNLKSRIGRLFGRDSSDTAPQADSVSVSEAANDTPSSTDS